MERTIIPCMRDGWVVGELGEVEKVLVVALMIVSDAEVFPPTDEDIGMYAITSAWPDDWLKVGRCGSQIKSDSRVALSVQMRDELVKDRTNEKYIKRFSNGEI